MNRIFSIFICILLVGIPSVLKSQTAKHTVGVNFLRLTDLSIIGDISNIQTGFSPTLGLTYQFALKQNANVRFAYAKDRKYMKSNGFFSDFTELSERRMLSIGIQAPLNPKKTLSWVIILDGYATTGSLTSNNNMGRNTSTPIIAPWQGVYHNEYIFDEFGLQVGLGKTVQLSKAISFTIESAAMFGERHQTDTKNQRTSIFSVAHFNPVSRFSLNYSFK